MAAAVGRLSVRAIGDASPAADRVAHALGRALLLTNILRDLAADAAHGRLYLSREWLEAEGVPPDPAGALASPALGRVGARVAAMADGDRRAMKPARLMGATYAAVLAALERRRWVRVAEPASVSRWRKLRILLRYGPG